MAERADEKAVDRLAEAARLLLTGDRAAGQRVLEPLSGQTIVKQPLVLLEARPPGPYELTVGPLTSAPGLTTQAHVFAHDRYTCVYCGRRTIFLQVLNLLSSAFRDELPRHSNWKKTETHRLYWDLTTSIDHVRPVSRGGDVEAIENLATVCARCQYQKGNRPLESLGWTVRAAPAPWDGLTKLYEPVWQLLGTPAGVHRRWFAAIQAAGQAGLPIARRTSQRPESRLRCSTYHR